MNFVKKILSNSATVGKPRISIQLSPNKFNAVPLINLERTCSVFCINLAFSFALVVWTISVLGVPFRMPISVSGVVSVVWTISYVRLQPRVRVTAWELRPMMEHFAQAVFSSMYGMLQWHHGGFCSSLSHLESVSVKWVVKMKQLSVVFGFCNSWTPGIS